MQTGKKNIYKLATKRGKNTATLRLIKAEHVGRSPFRPCSPLPPPPSGCEELGKMRKRAYLPNLRPVPSPILVSLPRSGVPVVVFGATQLVFGVAHGSLSSVDQQKVLFWKKKTSPADTRVQRRGWTNGYISAIPLVSGGSVHHLA